MIDATPTADTNTICFYGTDEISNDGNGQRYTRDREADLVADDPKDEVSTVVCLWIRRTTREPKVCEAVWIETKRKWRPSGRWVTDEYACRTNVTRPDHLKIEEEPMTDTPAPVKPKKDEKKNIWISPKGVELISSTMVLREVGLMSYKGGVTAAMDRGTDVHNGVEQLLKGEPLTVTDAALPYLESFMKFLEQAKPKPVHLEKRMWDDELKLCGQVDLIAEMMGVETVIDYKTGSPAPWHELQTASYALLYHPGDPRVKLIPRGALYLDGKGAMARWKSHDNPTDFDSFSAALHLAWWKRQRGVKGWLMEK